MRFPSAAKAVAYTASLLLAGYGGFAGHAAIASPTPPPPVAAAPTATAPVPAPEPAVPALEQIPIPNPPVVTGLPYLTECHAQGKLPDPGCTPGSVNPAVTQANISSTICRSGWTATVRPPAANTGPVKRAAMKAYGIPAAQIGTVELDHLVPLELGGSDDASNLWSEVSDRPGHGFNNTKDVLETELKTATCEGLIQLDPARVAIASNWTTAFDTLGLVHRTVNGRVVVCLRALPSRCTG